MPAVKANVDDYGIKEVMPPKRRTALLVLAVVLASAGRGREARALTACTAAAIVAQDSADCPSGTGPCTIGKDFTIPNGCVLDFGARDVTIANLTTLSTGSGTVTFKARNFTVGGGGFIDGRGNSTAPNDVGGFVIIQATQAVSVLKQTTRIGHIDVSGNTSAGTMELDAQTAVTISGHLNADSLTSTGSGGFININAGTNITTASGTTVSSGGGQTTFGEVDMTAGGQINLADAINVNGFDGGIVNLTAGANAVVQGINAKGTGSGSSTNILPGGGGNVSIEAGTQVQLQGPIVADGTGGGCGGCVDVAADFGNLTVSQPISADAALPDQGGGGGMVSITAAGSINVQSTGSVAAVSVGSLGFGGLICLDTSGGVDITTAGALDVSGGCGGCIDVDARGNVTLNAPLRANADAFGAQGGMICVTSGDMGVGTLSIGSTVDISGGPCSTTNGCGDGGCTMWEGCNVSVTANGKVDARAPNTGGTNAFTAHEQLTIFGNVLATTTGTGSNGANTVAYPSRKPPVIGAGLVVPPPLPTPFGTCTDPGQQGMALCLDPCPVCGNGVVEFPETCDNNSGTPLSCDGCSRWCQLESCNDNNVCTLDTCDPLLGCNNVLQPPCPTSTPTATVPPTPTPTALHVLSGHINYFGSGLPLAGVSANLTGPTPQATVTDSTGAFGFTGLAQADWTLTPSSQTSVGNAISALDAVFVLQAAVGSRQLTAPQAVACDTSGNGLVTPLDAVFILQYAVGLIKSLPVAQACGSPWAFVPAPASTVMNEQLISPALVQGTCQHGALVFPQLMSDASNQNFAGAVIGDCNGNWQPPPGAAVALAQANAAQVRFAPLYRGRGGRVRFPLRVESPASFQALETSVSYDPTRLQLVAVRRLNAARPALVQYNARVPGMIKIALASAQPMVSGGDVLALDFERPLSPHLPLPRVLTATVDGQPAAGVAGN